MEKRHLLRCRGTCTLVATALVTCIGFAAIDANAFGADRTETESSTASIPSTDAEAIEDAADAVESDSASDADENALDDTESEANENAQTDGDDTAADDTDGKASGDSDGTSIGDALDEDSARQKSAVPTLTKQVGEVSGDETIYGRYSDAGIGQEVPYRLIGTLPSSYDEYEAFPYTFTDQLDGDMSLVKDSVTVSVRQGDKQTALSKANVKTEDQLLEVSWDDLKKEDVQLSFGDEVVVEYRATIKPGTTRFGKSGAHLNRATLTYANDPAGSSVATTEAVRTETYTYQLQITKLGSKSQALQGAGFCLFDADGNIIGTDGTRLGKRPSKGESSKATVTSSKKGRVTFSGLDAGTYTLTETKAPKGYTALSKPITIEIGSNVTEQSDKLSLTAKVSDDAKLESVDVANGRVSMLVANQKSNGQQTGGKGKDFGGTKNGNGTTTSGAGSAFHKTGNPLIDYWWAFLIAAAGAIGLIVRGLHLRKCNKQAATSALLASIDDQYPTEEEPDHDRN